MQRFTYLQKIFYSDFNFSFQKNICVCMYIIYKYDWLSPLEWEWASKPEL